MEQAVISPPCIERAATACEAFAHVVTVRRINDERAIVLGTFADGTGGVAIVDPRTSRGIDGFACFHPAISPDGKYIAFERYFSLGAHIALRYRGIVAVYDLTRSPRENRERGGDVRLPGRVVNPLVMTGDASERWVDDITWLSSTELKFAVRYDERTHDVIVTFHPSSMAR